MEDVMGNSNQGSKKRKSKRAAKKRRNQIILFSIEFIVLAVLCVVLYIVIKFYNSNNTPGENDISGDTASGWDLFPQYEGGEDVPGYKLVALFGVDSREGELKQNTRTDTIMIACLNEETKEYKLLSVYRDTYLNLSNDSYNKCNAAYAKGGGNQALNMLNMNLDLNIDKFITVGFKGVVETVDSLGGVPIDIKEEEMQYLNSYQSCICDDLNRQSEYKPITTPGLQTLTGLQACGYCRIRYTAGSDFKRTERQRTVLYEMLEQSKKMNITQVNDVVNSSFSNICTNMSMKELLDFAADYASYTKAADDGFPFEQNRGVATIGKTGSCVIPLDLTSNVVQAHEFLFGETDYEPSDTVVKCSEKIKEDTTPYLDPEDLAKIPNYAESEN